jgi:hypothetical protein
MNPSWVVALVSILGIVGQLWIGARNSGAREERMRAHGFRIKDLEDGQRNHGSKLQEHGERIARVETRLSNHGGAD